MKRITTHGRHGDHRQGPHEGQRHNQHAGRRHDWRDGLWHGGNADRRHDHSLTDDLGASAQRERDVERFGRWAATYEESALQRLLFEHVHDLTLREAAMLVPAPRAILDIGCGTGVFLRLAAARFPAAELTGVDAAAGMIEAARAASPADLDVHFVQAEAERLPLPSAAFDLVVTTMSFHHWADQPEALREVRRVLTPEGAFVLADALPNGWLRWVMARRGHARFHPPDSLARMLCQSGLQPVRLVPVPRFGGTLCVGLARPLT